jgi:hypothetical protein
MLKKIEADERRPSPELARLLAAALAVPGASHAAFVAAVRGERMVEAVWPLGAGTDDEAAAWQDSRPPPLPRPATTFVGHTPQGIADPAAGALELTVTSSSRLSRSPDRPPL